MYSKGAQHPHYLIVETSAADAGELSGLVTDTAVSHQTSFGVRSM